MRVSSSHILQSPRGFVVIEGLNGAGKTTLIKAIDHYLTHERRKQTLITRECGSPHSKLCLEIADIVKHSEDIHILPRTEAFLFATDRAQHRDEVINPALERGEIVISDRYFYSSVAFQGYGRGLDPGWVMALNKIAIAELLPDFVVLLDISAEQAEQRIRKRALDGSAQKRDRMEVDELEFHQRVRQGFLTQADQEPTPFVVLDAMLSTEALLEQLKTLLIQLVYSNSHKSLPK